MGRTVTSCVLTGAFVALTACGGGSRQPIAAQSNTTPELNITNQDPRPVQPRNRKCPGRRQRSARAFSRWTGVLQPGRIQSGRRRLNRSGIRRQFENFRYRCNGRRCRRAVCGRVAYFSRTAQISAAAARPCVPTMALSRLRGWFPWVAGSMPSSRMAAAPTTVPMASISVVSAAFEFIQEQPIFCKSSP